MINWGLIYSEFDFSFSRSSGPGGQNVNKTETKAELRWPYLKSEFLTSHQKALITLKAVHHINKNDELYIQADNHRNRIQNQEECVNRIKEIVLKATFIPKPRKKTKPSRGSIEKRLSEKKRHSQKKQNRIKDY